MLQLGKSVKRDFDRGYNYAWSIDRSSWDACITTSAQEGLFDFFKRISPFSRFEQICFNAQTKTWGVTANGSFYRGRGRVHSGDPNTTLGNTLLSFVSAEYTLRALGITDYQFYATGDDALILFRGKPQHSLVEFASHQEQCFQIVTTGKEAKHPVDFDFLSACPLPVVVDGILTWCYTPLFGKCFPKLMFSISLEAHLDPFNWLSDLLYAMKYLVNHHPWFSPILETTLSFLDVPTHDFAENHDPYRRRNDTLCLCSTLADSWLGVRYGSTNALNLKIELLTELSRVESLPSSLDLPAIFAIAERDN